MDRSVPEIDVGALLRDRKLGRFHVLTFGLCVLILFVDGLDYSAANVAGSQILREFQSETSALGIVFSMGFVGILTGSIVFGYIGDRYGRKLGAVLGVLAYSIPALVTVFATSIDQLILYRAAAGLGIGGVIPNVLALLTETAPKRLRVTFGMVVFIGYSSGNAVAGWIGPWLIPQFGWQVMFLVAGAAGLVLSLVLAFVLPESIPFLAATDPDAPRLRRLVRWAAPELPIASDTRFIYHRPGNETEFSLKLLFSGIRRIATPLLWVAFFAESMAYLTLTAWIIVLLEQQGLQAAKASFAYSYAQLAAIAATLFLARLFDRYGVLANAATAFVSVLAIAAVGSFNASPLALIVASIFAQGVASATHQSLNGMVGGFYPTVIRGNGVGIASSMGRVGAIVGPAAAGYLLMLFPAGTVLVFIALPDLVVAAACLALHVYARAGLNAAA